jgi:CRP/FNR family transcriptional regulator
MTTDIKELLREEVEQVNLISKDFLYREKDPAEDIFCLEQGILAVLKKDENQKNFLVGFIEPGQLIGLNAVRVHHYPHSIQAITDAKLLKISQNALHQLMQDNFAFRLEIVQEMCKEVSLAESKLVKSRQKNTKQKLAILILEILKAYNRVLPNSSVINLSYSLCELAELIGIPKKNASKTIAEFKAEGLIKKDGAELKVLNPVAIAGLV